MKDRSRMYDRFELNLWTAKLAIEIVHGLLLSVVDKLSKKANSPNF